MPEEAPTSSSAAAEDGLELTRWGTRFVHAGTEARYRGWSVEQAIPFNRAGLVASVVVWLSLVALFLALGVFRSWVPVVAFVAVPVVLWAILTTLRRSLLRWMTLSTLAANMVAGFIVVGLARERSVAVEVTFGGLFIANYFGFAIFRARPTLAAFAVAPYMLWKAVSCGLDLQQGLIDVATFAGDVFGLTTALFTGLTINVVFDMVSRRSYRQERIIEAQKETISRERARSEALLKKELSHQVAERSRELGDALARIGAPDAAALPPGGGQFHTRYRVVRPLGEGGMGAVFEVERLTDSEQLALKIVTGRVSGSIAARFAREAEIGARVHHPNLISIVDIGIAENGAPYLVMELVRGGSLEACRARFGAVAWGLPILKQIALGLSVLHEAGVVHRDLKPGNVLLDGLDDAAPVAKISDFGISRFGRLEDSETDPEAPTLGASTPRTPDLTGTGVLLGTPNYMAPEAARGGRSLDAAADVFAFGVMAYEVLTGRAPFETPAVLMALAGRPLPAVLPIQEGALQGAGRDALVACLSEDPKSRPSARSVHDALDIGEPA